LLNGCSGTVLKDGYRAAERLQNQGLSADHHC
jgi:hypothetical protein